MCFSNVEKVFLGNMLDKNSYIFFYKDRELMEVELNDNNIVIGKWWMKLELGCLVSEVGW